MRQDIAHGDGTIALTIEVPPSGRSLNRQPREASPHASLAFMFWGAAWRGMIFFALTLVYRDQGWRVSRQGRTDGRPLSK